MLLSPTATVSQQQPSDPDMDTSSAGSSQRKPKEVEIKKEPEENEKCAVCLAPHMSIRTSIDCCNHQFCHICLRKWLLQAKTCPVCRQKPREIFSNVGKPNEQRYTLDELEKEKEEEERLVVGNAFPMTNEKEILIKRKHELNRIINRLQPTEMRTRWKRDGQFRRKDTCLRTNGEYQEAVTERNAIQLLLDGIEDRSLDRQSLISHPSFRTLIYLYDCEWYLVDPTLNPHMGRITRQLAREDEDAQRDRLKNFIVRELVVVPIAPPLKHNMKGRAFREKCARYIFDECLNHQIHSPGFSRILVGLNVGIMRHAIERFQHELFEFASSQLSMVEYCKISGYRLPEDTRRNSPNDNNFAVGGLNDVRSPDVITLNDTVADDDIVISDDEPVVVGSVQGERNNGRNESHYVRDEPISSGSDRDEMFHRPACRLRQHAPIGMDWLGTHNMVNPPFMGPLFNCNGILNGNEFLDQFGSHNPRPAPRYEQIFGDLPSTSGLRSRSGSEDVHIIDVRPPSSRSNSRSSPATPISARSPGYSRMSSDGDASYSRSIGSTYDTPGCLRIIKQILLGSGENSNSSRETRHSRKSERRSRRNSEESERSTSRVSKYRSKLETYHRNLGSFRDKQESIDWLRRELTKLEGTDRDRNGSGMDRGEDRRYQGLYTRKRTLRYNGNR